MKNYSLFQFFFFFDLMKIFILQKCFLPDFKSVNDVFICNQFRSLYGMASDTPTNFFKMFILKTIDLLSKKNTNIFTEKLKSKFQLEDGLYNFTETLFTRFYNISLLNSFSVRLFILVTNFSKTISSSYSTITNFFLVSGR